VAEVYVPSDLQIGKVEAIPGVTLHNDQPECVLVFIGALSLLHVLLI
jgi:hypothetical protein